jgi:hypothetical protein
MYRPSVRPVIVYAAPSTPVWLQMLTIFIPALVALIVVMIGQAWTAKSAREAEERTVWRALQQSVLLETQDRLMDNWVVTAKLLRGADHPDLPTAMEEASTRLTILGPRIADRQLATDIADWHHELAKAIGKVVAGGEPFSPEQITSYHRKYVALADRLGAAAIELRPKSIR